LERQPVEFAPGRFCPRRSPTSEPKISVKRACISGLQPDADDLLSPRAAPVKSRILLTSPSRAEPTDPRRSSQSGSDIALRGGLSRASPHPCNAPADIDAALGVLQC